MRKSRDWEAYQKLQINIGVDKKSIQSMTCVTNKKQIALFLYRFSNSGFSLQIEISI